jgi:predicted nucleotidyltransferase
MSTAATPGALDALPPATRAPLQALKEGLEKAVGSNLAALVVYGSAARGGYVPDESDIDVIVVLDDTSLPQLHKIAEPLTQARYGGRVEAMILKRDNLARAADVFPLLYDDLRQRHVVLSGRDVFAGLAVADTHRRLRIEQELREARIRMRRAVVDALGSESEITGAVARKVKQVRSPLHALLCLKGKECDDRLEAVLAAAGREYGLDTSPLTRVREQPEAAHTALRALLDFAIEDVDRLPDGAPA